MNSLTSWILASLEAFCVGELERARLVIEPAPIIPNNTCTLGICVDLAQQLVKQTTYNTTEIDLCNDFETFVCDGWRAEHELRPDQGSVIYHNLLQDRSTDIVHAYLDASNPPIDAPADRKTFALAKQTYQACMNETEIRRQGTSPLAGMLVNITNIFQVDELVYIHPGSTYIQETDSVEVGNLLLHLQSIGVPHVLNIGVTRDNKDPSSRIIHIAPPSGLTLAKDYYQDTKVMEDYTRVMTKLLSALHPIPQARNKAGELAKLVVDFEIRMDTILPRLSDLHDVNKFYHILSLSDTAKLASIFNLHRIVTEMTSHTPDYNPHDHDIMTSFPDLIQGIGKTFRNTSKEVVQTYFIWRVIESLEHTILAPEMEPLRVFRNILGGRDPTAFPDRWRVCVDYVSSINNLGWIIARFYSAEHFSLKDKDLGQQLVTYITTQYQETMRTLPWLDDPVRSVAIQKLANLQALMGFPDTSKPVDLTNSTSVLSHYADILPSTTPQTSHFSNIQTLTARSIARAWASLPTPYDKGEWLMTPQTVNAYNDIGSGVIAFPAAILQPPYFSAALPSYINFGITGWTIGHEVSHSFDMSGREYDLQGRYGHDWWTPETDAAFRERSQCFVEQYGNYTIEGLDGKPLHLNGRLTLGENIADAGGIDTAYLAWQRHRVDHPEQDMDLPGLEGWSHERLYFVAFASLWCSKSKKELLVSQVYDDSHSRPRFRVKGTLENSRYFREVFGCQVKEPTCKIW